ncbi:hypothetical protein NDN08_000468 [Rhodosorus marinus]|uniref:FLZ-type domain-containing protein n=1 Tax=Rhodosorus marinus TaxID=101924 RepID=A0AAV8US62_9RHOD|nr:hypothetical protein NDN08_000468 [Rhodosorus marinus]
MKEEVVKSIVTDIVVDENVEEELLADADGFEDKMGGLKLCENCGRNLLVGTGISVQGAYCSDDCFWSAQLDTTGSRMKKEKRRANLRALKRPDKGRIVRASTNAKDAERSPSVNEGNNAMYVYWQKNLSSYASKRLNCNAPV